MKFIEATVTHTFRAPAERVFDAWLQPPCVRQWLGAALRAHGLSGDIRRVEIDARVGGKFVFSDMRNGEEAVHWGTYLEIQRPRKIAFGWFTSEADEKEGSSLVTLTIEPQATGCIATIVHRMNAEYAQYVGQTERGWSGMLRQVDALTTPTPAAAG